MAGERHSVSCYLDERTFRHCCQLFLQHSVTIQDGWSWEEIKGTDEGFMRKTVLIPVRPDTSHHQDVCSVQTENTESLTEELQADVEDEAAGVQAVCESPVVLRYEYHVVYSSSYQIPVLYFRVSTLDGRSVSLEEVWSNVHPNYRQRLRQEPWDTLTQQEHPLLGQPFFMLHPCRTEEFMKPALDLSQSQHKSCSSVRQISITSEPQRSFFLKVEWAEDLGSGFIVLLSDGVSAWSGEVSEEDVSREARDIEMERERYIQDLHLALTGEGQTAEGVYAFHLAPVRPSSPLLQLSYEKVQSDISFRLGVVELQAVPEPSEVIRELITHSLDLSKHLEAKNQHLLEENHKLRQEQHHISTQMERYVEEKERLERELYGRFVLVLNEKKGKIRDLQAGLDELQQSVDEDEVRRKQEKSEEPEAEKSSGQEGDYDGSTEEEQEEDHTRPERCAPPKEMSENSPMDESLNDITDVAPCRKRRHRHLQQPESEAKRAALPHRSRAKPTEVAKAESSRTPNVQRRPAAATAVPDPDDLFEDF